MNKIFFLIALLAPIAVQAAAPVGEDKALAAILTHESHEVTAEGVTKEFRYQERFIRSGGHVWAERILPEGIQSKPEAGHKAKGEHEHEFNFNLAAKHIAKDAKGNLNISFANMRDKVIVAIAREEYQTVGFDGSWESAYYLVNPAAVKKLPLSKAPSPVAKARWYEKQGKEDYYRVLWAEDLELPLVIESGTRNGNRHSRISSKIVQLPQSAGLPWMNLQNFEHKDYNDLLD